MSDRVETIGDCTLYLGDCREVLPTLGKVDAVVTDPPYGIGHVHSGKAAGKWTKANSKPIVMDAEPFDPRPFLIAPAAMFGADHFAEHLPNGGIFHVWDKECGRSGRNDSFSDAELFWTSWPGKRRVIRYMWKGLQVEHPAHDQERFHPTQKPVAVMAAILAQTPPGVILDPFMGSGTTGVACVQLGRAFIGIEVDSTHFATACRRIEAAYKQPRLFDEPPPKPTQERLFG